MAHGFGPTSDFAKRFEAAYDAAEGRVWINRHGYLSDEKLDIIGKVSVST